MADSQKNMTDATVKTPVLQPPIIMKIDGPEESNGKEEEENENNIENSKNEEFKMCSPSYRPSIPNNPFSSFQSKVSKGILKPPQFSLNSSNQTSFTLKPSQLNHFPKAVNSDKPNSEKTESSESKVINLNGDPPKFVPLVVPEKTIPNANESSQNQPSETNISSSSFVFGENLKDRVVVDDGNKDSLTASTSLDSNGSSEMLFSSAIKNELKQDVAMSKDKDVKSLSESAREYEESRANKRKYDEVEVVTGEENETNILNISCKLFSFNKTSSNWLELGRGNLRLNDLKNEDDNNHAGSRLVFRTSGSLRVIMNTKIWAEMIVEKASEKSIRITALDANGEIKVFLVMSNIEDSNRLYSHLRTRLEREIAAQKRKKTDNSNSTDN